LFTSSVFEGIGEDYLASRKIPDRLFIKLASEGIIPRYPTNTIHTSIFLARLKTLHYGRIFLGKVFEGIKEYWMNTKSPHIPTCFRGENSREVNKA
jgi:hypothetical protein